MSLFERIGVYLTDRASDSAVVAHARDMVRRGARHIRVIQSQDPAAGPGDHSGLADLKREAEAAAGGVFRATDAAEGGGLTEILEAARDDSLDLIIVGRRLLSSEGRTDDRFTRVARKAPCSVLIAPELERPHFSRMLAAVDCSGHSQRTIEMAIELARTAADAPPQLVVLTVRQVDPGYYRAGVSYEEAEAAQHRYGERDLDQLMSPIDTQGVSVERQIAISLDPAEAIAEIAAVRKMDLVVIGSRGLSRAAVALLGSVSERILQRCPLPVLIVKEKGETLHVLEALFTGRS